MREIEFAQQFTDTFGTHRGMEIVAEFFDLGEVIIFGQQLALVQRRHAGIGHDEGFKVQDAFDIAERHVQHHAEPRRQRFQEPDVCSR